MFSGRVARTIALAGAIGAQPFELLSERNLLEQARAEAQSARTKQLAAELEASRRADAARESQGARSGWRNDKDGIPRFEYSPERKRERIEGAGRPGVPVEGCTTWRSKPNFSEDCQKARGTKQF